MRELVSRRDSAVEDEAWEIADSRELYRFAEWAEGYFDINRMGHLAVRPFGQGGPEADLYELVRTLQGREVGSPILLDFLDIVDDRLRRLREAFGEAIRESGYRAGFTSVYRVGVDPRRTTVEAVLRHSPDDTGLEVGSKAELFGALAITGAQPNCLIVCDGFRDHQYLEAVMLAAKLGRRILCVVSSVAELEAILEASARHGVRPSLGLRVALERPGSERQDDSPSRRPRSGLGPDEVLAVVERLRAGGMLDLIELVRGVPGRRSWGPGPSAGSVSALTRIYAELSTLGAELRYLDVGGGPGVSCSGTPGNEGSPFDRTPEGHARDVVRRVGRVCDDLGARHPTLLGESGRTIAALQSVLVFEVVEQLQPWGATEDPDAAALAAARQSEHPPVRALAEALEAVPPGSALESCREGASARDRGYDLFSRGRMGLQDLATLERLFRALCRRTLRRLDKTREIPPDLAELSSLTASTCLCNLSVIQSLPDVRTRGGVFPILPIQRLDERPDRPSVLLDPTDDPDGSIDRFPGPDGARPTLDLHAPRPRSPYFLAAFLAGAQQRARRGPHDMLGGHDTVQIRVGPDGSWRFAGAAGGGTLGEVLADAGWDNEQLKGELALDCRTALATGRITAQESRDLLRSYDQALRGSTYLASIRSRV